MKLEAMLPPCRSLLAQLAVITTIDEISYGAWAVRNRAALAVGFMRSGRDPDEAPVYMRELYIRTTGIRL